MKIFIVLLAMTLAILPVAAKDGASTILGQTSISEVSIAADLHASMPRSAGLDPALEAKIRGGIEAGFREMRTMANNDYVEFGDDFFRRYSLTINWTEYFVSARYLSLVEEVHQYTGGAHGNFGFSSLLWDLKTHREITLEDMFVDVSDNSPALRALSKHLRKALVDEKMSKAGLDRTEAETDEGLNQLTTERSAFGEFALVPTMIEGKAAGLEFLYGPYHLGSYAEGDYRLYVPAEIFAEFLKPEFGNLFAGEPVRLERLSNFDSPGPTILLEEPRISEGITSPLTLKGEAPDYWFEDNKAKIEIHGDDGKIADGEIEAYPDATVSGAASGMIRFIGEIKFEAPEGYTYLELRFLRGAGDAYSGGPAISWWFSP